VKSRSLVHRALARVQDLRGPRIVVRPVFGITNRLRAVTSAEAIAQHYGLRFAMRWESSEGFSDEGWNDLFANRFKLLSRREYERELHSGRPLLSEWLKRVPGQGLRPLPAFDSLKAMKEIQSRGLIYDFGYLPLERQLQKHGVHGMEKVEMKRLRCCQKLRPAPAIARIVDEYVVRHFAGREVVGVHIRRGDALTGPWAARQTASSDEVFAHAMNVALKMNDGTVFFLATDCEKTEDWFRQEFGERLLTMEKHFVESVYGAPKAGQKEAVTELFLLSRTGRIIGTCGSTFGRTAGEMGGIDFQSSR
jgi:hypothetical protein